MKRMPTSFPNVQKNNGDNLPNRPGARSDVLSFYRDLPFNYRVDAQAHAGTIRRGDSLRAYPPLIAALAGRPRLLDVGCGAGWLVNSAAFHHKCVAKGIDFNSVAVERAREVAKLLRIDSQFDVADIFNYFPTERFTLVTSIGVLHHTDNCLGAIAHIARSLVDEGGRMFIGLYHAFGRQPFLAHFDSLKRGGASEDAMFAEFKRIRTGGKASSEDEVFLQSWFRDQVLHPHETTHTLAEMLPLLDEFGFELESTSINRFAPLTAREKLIDEEKQLEQAGRAALANGNYFPGFFVFMARRKSR